MKKKAVSMVLTAAVAAALLAGCGSTSQGAAAAADSAQSTEEEPAELTVWSWDASFNGAAFEEADKLDDSVKVNFVEMGKADCLEKLHTVLSSGVTEGLPDIVTISDLNAQGYLMAYPGAFLPMDDYLNYDDFAPYKKAYVSYDGAGYGVPFDTGVAGLFYRSDYIEEAGYTDEDMQELSWDEYEELGKKLREKGHYLQTFNPNDVANMQILLQSAGAWFTDDAGKADFVNNAALKEAYRLFREFNDGDFVKKVSDWNEFAGAINGGDVACVIRGSWITSTIKGGTDQSGLWKLAPIPTLDGVEGAVNRSNQGGSSIYVLANGAHPEEAARFLAKTFGGSTELYNVLAEKANIMGTYLPASDVEAYSAADEFFGGQQINATLAGWIAEIPSINPGAYSAEAQAALLAVTPNILAGSDLDAELEAAEAQFNAAVQE
ncbi:extracellular solute-binding protein [Lachnoclostridium sp. Marseille-P6806]|uniref:extracellular solute-binding protein n=1 Tax=Lachnoclostridium sp. Marseille-P6806 TaxID=2364793 RepID=UPI0013EF4022|nr:extracellular solute-binding protein [Lachnoclostridium sp. Marseille-P6806]